MAKKSQKAKAQVIKAMRFSFVQVETLANALATAPKIPYAFLVNQALYQAELQTALTDAGPYKVPWHDLVGRLFWYYYLEKKRPDAVTAKDAWRALVPLTSKPTATVSADWLTGAVETRTHLYPWGIGAVIDITASGDWTIDSAIEFAFKVKQSGKYTVVANAAASEHPLSGVIDEAMADLRTRAYGPAMAAGRRSETFSVAAVLDAEKANPKQAVQPNESLHRALEAMTDWSPQYKNAQLGVLADRSIELKRSVSPVGHVLYGGRRGRAVWFPAGFPSSAPMHAEGLECYYRNLVISSLQTESLCCLIKAVAADLVAGQTLGQFKVMYGSCARLAAGILGRLYGGSLDTYRSHSVRDQIHRTYLNEVNRVRNAANLSPLP